MKRLKLTGNLVVIPLSLDAVRAGKVAAPKCEASPTRACPDCGADAVLPLDADMRAKQPDHTTHVCHPLLGGCNAGFTVYA